MVAYRKLEFKGWEEQGRVLDCKLYKVLAVHSAVELRHFVNLVHNVVGKARVLKGLAVHLANELNHLLKVQRARAIEVIQCEGIVDERVLVAGACCGVVRVRRHAGGGWRG